MHSLIGKCWRNELEYDNHNDYYEYKFIDESTLISYTYVDGVLMDKRDLKYTYDANTCIVRVFPVGSCEETYDWKISWDANPPRFTSKTEDQNRHEFYMIKCSEKEGK